jgi:hypothetical protein
MKMTFKQIVLSAGLVASLTAQAGNEDRVGSAGASQLLINPWARSSAIGDASYANSNGLEATYMNIAGLAFTDKTQLKYNYSNWMGNAGISLNGAGIAQRISDSEVFSVSVQAMNYGDIPITTVANPEGNIGFFSPRFNIFSVGYAKEFSSSIYGGINFKVISESISNLKANGIAIDAGIRYVTGDKDQMKMGITLKNVGPPIKQKGDGYATQVSYVSTGEKATLEQRTQPYELPSLLAMGASYDFIFTPNSKLTTSLAFTGNSFSRDQYRLGLDYGFTSNRTAFNVRCGYIYEKYLNNAVNRTNALTGFTAGFSVDALVGENKSALGLEYSVRMSSPFGLIHTFGTTISLK